jgi:hypothetical protein
MPSSFHCHVTVIVVWPAHAQDAKKGVTFLDLPPVLQLQLKRFAYDFERDANIKVGAGA